MSNSSDTITINAVVDISATALQDIVKKAKCGQCLDIRLFKRQ